MIIPKLIEHLHHLVRDFSVETGSFEADFIENKKVAEWSLKYNLIKIEFILTKKDKMLCPITTLFCRIYLGKNDVCYYHLPELMEYLEPGNFHCYYFSYMESEERIEAAFSVLASFLKKHLNVLNLFAGSQMKYDAIKESKFHEMKKIMLGDKPDSEVNEYDVASYEKFVLLPRYAAQGAYREFVCGNYEKALTQYSKMQGKGTLTSYETTLLEFLCVLEKEYVALPEECNAVNTVREWDNPKIGKYILFAAIGSEIILGAFFAIIIVIINAILSVDAIYFAGVTWTDAFLLAGLPSIFAGIAFHNIARKCLQKDVYTKAGHFDSLVNPKWVNVMAKSIATILFIVMLFMTICVPFDSTGFHKDYLTYYETIGGMIPVGKNTGSYKDITAVYYSKGFHNVDGEYIDRPSYIIEFNDGTYWNSDMQCSIAEVEEYVLPMIENYYDQIEVIESRDAMLD